MNAFEGEGLYEKIEIWRKPLSKAVESVNKLQQIWPLSIKGCSYQRVMNDIPGLPWYVTYLPTTDDKQPWFNSSGRGNGITWPYAPVECLIRTPSRYDVGISESQKEMAIYFACSSIPINSANVIYFWYDKAYSNSCLVKPIGISMNVVTWHRSINNASWYLVCVSSVLP